MTGARKLIGSSVAEFIYWYQCQEQARTGLSRGKRYSRYHFKWHDALAKGRHVYEMIILCPKILKPYTEYAGACWYALL